MHDKKLQRVFRIIHILGWVTIALLPYLLNIPDRFGWRNILLNTKGLVFSIGLFYLFYGYVIRRYLKSNALLKFFVICFLFFCAYSAVELTVDYLVWPVIKPGIKYIVQAKLIGNIFINGFIVALALLVLLIENWFVTQKKQQELERERLESELRMLRFQVNPHFLFNTLNNIYTLVYKKSDKAPEAILKLSSLMRYMLYETEGSRVPLAKELEYLDNFVELQRLRLVDNQQVNMKVEGDAGGYQVAPLLLVPFIENAFKHGIRASKDTIIDIAVSVDNGILNFCCTNDYNPGISSQINSGIGMTNVKKRLELIYGGGYSLDIDNSNGKYKVTLRLSL